MVTLNKAINAWNPTPATGKNGKYNPAMTDARTEALLKTIRSILNKVTLEKFDKLTQQMLALDIYTGVQLPEVSRIFLENVYSLTLYFALVFIDLILFDLIF